MLRHGFDVFISDLVLAIALGAEWLDELLLCCRVVAVAHSGAGRDRGWETAGSVWPRRIKAGVGVGWVGIGVTRLGVRWAGIGVVRRRVVA